MTPEELAKSIVDRRDDWEESDYHWNGEDSVLVHVINEDTLHKMIAAAIREAVAEERERCAKLCDKRVESASTRARHSMVYYVAASLAADIRKLA